MDENIIDKVEPKDALTEREREIQFENEDLKADAQRKMAWISMFGMILYPIVVVIATIFGLDAGAKILGDIAGAYFVSVAAIIMAFFGAEAYIKKGK